MKDKVVIVTGGTRGIGFAISKAFAQEGAHVVMNFRSGSEQAEKALAELKSSSGKIITIQADVSSTEDRKRLVQETLDRFGKIDVLVNNAGVSARGGFLKGTEEEFDKMIECNLKGPVFLAQLVAKDMIEKNIEGSIINICSTAAYSASGTTSYCSSKAGLLMATKTMAYKLGPYNIRVNSVSPGAFKTDMSRRSWVDEPERGEALAATLPLRRGGDTDELAGAVIYLSSDKATYTTGTDIIVDGGWLLR